MQTFLPSPSFRVSAQCLDNKRLGKQRVECKQLLLALGVRVGDHVPRGGWRNHPATRMWRGHEFWLLAYAICVCREWIRRGFKDSLLPQFRAAMASMPEQPKPSWLGWRRLHSSHRSNLLRKDEQFYRRFGWSEPVDHEYVWPEVVQHV